MEIREKNKWIEYFKAFTPFLLIILTGFVGLINKNINNLDTKIVDIDNKLFHHLTNADLHTPRSLVVEKAEFSAIAINYDKNLDRLRQDNEKEHKFIRDSITSLIQIEKIKK